MLSDSELEEDQHLMLEFGYADENFDDRPMPQTSLIFPNFAGKSYDQLKEFIWTNLDDKM